MRGVGAALTLGLAVLASGCAATPHYVPPTHTYYLSPDGDDGAAGTSPETAWRTPARADRTGLAPGDRLLLKGGAHFRGTLTVSPDEAGDPRRPAVIGSYGTGRATLSSTADPAVTVHNTGGVEIRDLVLRGSGSARRHDPGLQLYSDRGSGGRPSGIDVSGVDVSGFRIGLAVGASQHGVGFRDVTVDRTRLHGNKDSGFLSYGPDFKPEIGTYAHEDLTLTDVAAYDNAGDPRAHDRHTGDGIVVGAVRGATLRRVEAHDNGTEAASDAPEGPVGVWAYDSTRVVVEHSAAYRNHTGSTVDGAGFGLDSNVTESALRRNLSFGNDGPGFYAYQRWQNGGSARNTISDNISADDGRGLPRHGSIAVYGKDVQDLAIVRNTVIVSRSPEGPGAALRLQAGERDVVVRDNLFVTGDVPLVLADAGLKPANVVLQGNAYRAAHGTWQVRWGEHTYDSLASWRAADGQESVDGHPTGLTVDPCLKGGPLPRIRSVADADLATPTCTSLAGEGLALPLPAGAPQPGDADYFGRTPSGGPQVGAVVPR
ncbi:right-handed parallel beta-helix repeat-containing protein [Streptomyces sp. NPDC059524]|uniref:right-handed parallel beta-helix repeat-containing protein n=1 Tax=Streptomyces sp. NPDC059524 TaxID=3346856 RepID=UPI0036AFDCB7